MKPKFISGRQSIAFWSWLQEHEEEMQALAKTDPGAALERIGKHFRKTYHDLAFELSASERTEKVELSVSACGDKRKFPLVLDIVKHAPEFEKFDVIPFRQRKPLSLMQDAMFSIQDVTIRSEDVFFSADQADRKLHLMLFMENYDGSDIYRCGGCVLLDCFLGEYDVVEYIAGLSFARLEKKHLFSVDPIWKLPYLVDSRFKRNN